jgi:hypothetical protein
VFYRTLDVEAILETLRRLERRISERFPDSGLLSICHELVSIAEDVQQRAKAVAAPNIALRAAVYVIILAPRWRRTNSPRAHARAGDTAKLFTVFSTV